MTRTRTKGEKGRRYIRYRGSARYVIKARSKEEALAIAQERFQSDAFDERKSFAEAELDVRITKDTNFRAIAGFEAEPGKSTPRPLVLEWKNKPSQSFATGTDKKPAHPRPKKAVKRSGGEQSSL